MLRKTVLLSLLLALIAVAGLVGYIVTLDLDAWVEDRVVRSLEGQFNLRVEVDQMKVHLTGTRLEIQGLRFFNRVYPAAEPAFECHDLLLDFSLTHFFRPSISLDRIQITSPRVRVLEDPNGRSNLSNMFLIEGPERSDRWSPTRLGIKQLVVTQGLLLYDQSRISIQSTDGAVSARLQYDPEEGKYQGQTTFKDLDLAVNGLSVPGLSVLVDFEWSEETFQILSLKLDSELLQTQARGRISGFTHLAYDLEGTASLNTERLAQAGLHSYFQKGVLSLSGKLSGAGEKFLFEGEARSDEVQWAGLPFERLALVLQLDSESLTVEDFKARLGSGALEARGNLTWIDGGESEWEVSASAVPIVPVLSAVGQNTLPVRGSVSVSAHLGWPSLQWREMKGAGSLAYRGRFLSREPSEQPAESAFSFEGNSRLGIENQTVRLSQGVLSTPQSLVNYGGDITLDGRYQFDLDLASNQSNEFFRLAEHLGVPERFFHQGFIDIEGPTRISASLRSGREGFKIEGSVDSQRIYLKGELLGDFRSRVDFDGTTLELIEARVAGPNYRLRTSLRLSLATGEIGWPLAAELELNEVPIERLLSFTEQSIPVEGLVTGELEVEQQAPFEFRGQGRVTVAEPRAYGEHLDRVSAEIQFEGHKIVLNNVRGTVGKGAVSGQIEVSLEDQVFTTELKGFQFPLGAIRQLQEQLPAQGDVDFDLRGRGPFTRPDLELRLQGNRIVIGDYALEDVALHAESLEESYQFRMDHRFFDNAFRLEGQIGRNESPHVMEAQVELREVPLDPYLSLIAAEHVSTLGGTVSGRLTAAGPLSDLSKLQVQAEFSRLTLSMGGYEFTNQSPLRLAYRRPTLEISPVDLKGVQTELQIRGQLNLVDNNTLNLEIKGGVNLLAANSFLSSGVVAGQLQLQTVVLGPLDNPRVLGTARVEKGLLIHPDLPADLFDAEGQLRFTSNQVALDRFSARTVHGPVNLDGGIFLEGLQPARWQIHVLAEGLSVEYPRHMISTLDANVDLIRNDFQDLIAGHIEVRSAEYMEDISIGQIVSEHIQSEGDTLLEAERQLKLALTVEAQQTLQARNNLIDAVGSMNLNVRGTLRNPVILGTVSVDEGRLFFEDNRYEITRGTVLFNNPYRTQPTWNLDAQTLVRDYAITVQIRGTFDRLRVSFSSDPPLPTADVVSLLMVGQTPEEILGSAGEGQTQIGNLAVFGAGTVLSRSLTGGLEARTSRLLGLERFSVDPFLFGNERDPGARVTLGKQLGKGLSVNYSTDLGSTQQSQIVVFEYRITDWLTALGTGEQDGSIAVDFKFKKRF